MEETLWLETGVLWFSASRCLEFHICTPRPCLLCLCTDVLVEGPLYIFFIKIVLLYLSVCLSGVLCMYNTVCTLQRTTVEAGSLLPCGSRD